MSRQVFVLHYSFEAFPAILVEESPPHNRTIHEHASIQSGKRIKCEVFREEK